MDGDNIGMIDLVDGFNFLKEMLFVFFVVGNLGVYHFDGDWVIVYGMLGSLVDFCKVVLFELVFNCVFVLNDLIVVVFWSFLFIVNCFVLEFCRVQ